MVDDARFEDGREAPLNLGAMDADDLKVMSALVQDAVLPITEMTYRARDRRFAMLLNRFRWENGTQSKERVQSMLSFESVLNVSSQGVDRSDKDMILSVLAVAFEAGEDGAGLIEITLAGDGAVRLSVETIEARLKDVTKPYIAPSKRAPSHPE
ncbi:DUF2948 family protein [Ascidiaceihabitans sp.]|uniref:DUF2948 family protein n=1 Tax=Ascidiaceihabitans sp. TaxID=1872644 RepID=UPI0032984856